MAPVLRCDGHDKRGVYHGELPDRPPPDRPPQPPSPTLPRGAPRDASVAGTPLRGREQAAALPPVLDTALRPRETAMAEGPNAIRGTGCARRAGDPAGRAGVCARRP